MKIVGVGGGPSGLYSALLLKKADPGHDITIYERYAADETFGWGVVFSDATLSSLREADLPSYTAITDSFVRWNVIDIHYRGETLRSGGHVFAAIARKRLLAILQQRCADLGVKLCFETEVADLGDFGDADLILACDGIHSPIRERGARVFRPKLDERNARYIWYGTPMVLDAFTFSFRDSPHGLFQAHAYPFDGTTSTFIVETSDETWRRAGLEAMDESESIAFCERLFADDLDGAPLLSNQSRWVKFVTVSNRSWSDGRVVLLGDAAHTAHFSIGSGTKLAMEDAIALATAVETHRELPIALAQYEKERRPVVDRFQEAAQDSLEYFENVSRYTHLEPLQFAFYLLTRSGRISYDSLRVRDPFFVGDVDAWFAGDQRLLTALPPALTPLRLASIDLANRIVSAPVSQAVASDGMPDDNHVAELAAAAASGAAVVVASAAISAGGRVSPADAGLYDSAHLGGWRRVVDAVHGAQGARAMLRLCHAGRRGATRPRGEGADLPLAAGAWPLVAASAMSYSPAQQVPAELAEVDMAAVIDAYTRATAWASDAGFDLLEVDAADGYLLASFLSPLTNQRGDRYGGTLETRLRLPLAVVDAVRAAWPSERPLVVRMTACDWQVGGLEPADGVRIARAFGEHGCDLVEVRAGHTTPGHKPVYEPGYLVGFGDQIRNEAQVPIMVGGGLRYLGDANTILAAGRADLCILDPASG